MIIWILFAVLTAAVVLAILRPMLRKNDDDAHVADEADLAVYQAQLTELDADVERGVIGKEEANAARIEVSRKILQLADADEAVDKDNSVTSGEGGGSADVSSAAPTRVRHFALVLAGLVPLCAAGLYAQYGSPNLPDLPHAPRLKQDIKSATAANLLARIEAHLRKNPNDGKGWELLAPVYLRAGRPDDAADAYRKTIRLLGETPDRLIGYVTAALQVNNGVVSEEVRKISEQLRAEAPDRAEPRFWLALAHEQDGNIEGARAAYQDLMALATDKSPWKAMVQKRLDGLGKPKTP